ncbi:L,D-transpeptidase [Longispora albida]|uniref:L,D-transpeptidase n=1 Tax=Longispora albida TaxID=203523 RepID=UPI000370579F|nr:Ig-like domain-containing protein [Longispora albida]
MRVTGRQGRWATSWLAAVLLASGCAGPTGTTAGPDAPARWVAPASPTPTAAPPSTEPPPSLVRSPANGATNVPVTAEIEVTGRGQVTLTDPAGNQIPGEFRADGSAWVPGRPLAYSTGYTVKSGNQTSAFTTMPSPGNRQSSGLYLFDGQVYGTAMPIVVEFPIKEGGGIPAAQRATVERRLFVKSDPPQVGAWHWDSDQAVEYRPKEQWKPGTKLSVRVGFEGLPLGDGRYGDVDRTASATIGDRSMVFTADNATKTLTVTRDGTVVQTYPISLGKPSTPSSYGNLVIMSRERTSHFVSTTPGDSYDQVVDYGERLTWGGQYIHAAPWSVDDQGVRNVSHGCVNLSTENAGWVFENSLIGDMVVVKGTEAPLTQGDGWTVWDLTWEQVQAGSAVR